MVIYLYWFGESELWNERREAWKKRRV